MSDKKSWLNGRRKNNKDSYLKYEEGEVVPVESHRPGYPPFLNEKDDGVKKFKDVLDEQKRDIKPAPEKNDSSFFHKKEGDSASPSPKKPKRNFSILSKLIWLAIIGGMIYYSIPILQYFSSESQRTTEVVKKTSKETVSKVDTVASDGVNKSKETIEDIKTTAMDTVDNVTNKADEIIGDVSQGSGLVDLTKAQLPTGNNVALGEQESSGSLTDDQWLALITTSQNQKQEILLELQNHTSDYMNGHFTQSRYRLTTKGIAQKAGRIQQNLDQNTKGIDTSQVDAVINALQLELEHLNDMSVNLSSLSSDTVPVMFNEEIDEQNRLTNEYRTVFVSLLDTYGKTYREESGVIIYN